jgi:hypothetical protein
VFELDGVLDGGEEEGDYFGLDGFGVLDEDGIVDLKEQLYSTQPPDFKHPSIENVTDRPLRIVRNCFADSCIVISTPEKPSPPSCKSRKVAICPKLLCYGRVPLSVGGESLEIFLLEIGNELLIQLSVLSHSVGLTVIVSSVPEDFSHMSI